MEQSLRLIKLTDEMHHCASIAHCYAGTFLAFYVGKECTDEQRVVIYFKSNHGYEAHIELPNKTGNPVIWNQNGDIKLLYSTFEDEDEKGEKPRTPVDRWKFCNNWLCDVGLGSILSDNGRPAIGYSNIRKIDGAFGLLGRCAPYVYKGEAYLPLYREKNPQCEIWKYTNDTLEHYSTFGSVDHNWISKEGLSPGSLGIGVAIQPTVFQKDDKLVAYCRNTARLPAMREMFAWYTVSEDGGKTWSDLTKSGIPNHNNSIVVSNRKDRNYMVFNLDARRQKLCLFNPESKQINYLSYAVLHNRRSSFSYPNYTWDENDNLHIVHTNCQVIAWHTFDMEFLDISLG